MTRAEERVLRSALIFAISEPRWITTSQNAAAVSAYFERHGLSGESVAHYNRAFASLGEQLTIPRPKATAIELERLTTEELQTLADVERRARQRSFHRFRPGRHEGP